jgi:hypothetical protein
MSKMDEPPTRLEIRPRKLAVSLVTYACAIIFGVGVLLITQGKLVGLLPMFLSVGVTLYFVPKMRRRIVSFVLTPEGLSYDTLHGMVLIKWETIEAIGIVWRNFQPFVGIRLRNYDAYLAGIPKDLEVFWKRFLPIMKVYLFVVGRYTTTMGNLLLKLWSALERSPDPAAQMKKMGRIADIASALAWSREYYGYDLGFPWTEFDRSPRRFLQLLEQWRSRYVPKESASPEAAASSS